MISQTAEYALRAIIYLAEQPDESRNNREVAQETKVPLNYLAKVLQCLARNGIIVSQRGAKGGFKLARGPEAISVYDVIQAVDPLHRITSCPLELEQHRDHLCPLHRRLDDAMALVEKSFRETSISELIEPVLQIG